jgi:hypothetical protein
MTLQTLQVRGTDALRLLDEHRARYPQTGLYPFLIGDDEDLARLREATEFNDGEPGEIIEASLGVNLARWIAGRREEAEEYEFSPEEVLGEWPAEMPEKGSIGLHTDILTGRVKPTVYFGLAPIAQPWHLPAFVHYGAWNECPEPEVHCAFHRAWFERFGAEITGLSGDTVECLVRRPPATREAALALAWEQYWYCQDIVEQGCGSVSDLAATLLDSPYWFFWWD